MGFCEKLKMLMKRAGISKAELARRTGIPQQQIGQYVLGRYKPKAPTVFVLAEGLGVSPFGLFNVFREGNG